MMITQVQMATYQNRHPAYSDTDVVLTCEQQYRRDIASFTPAHTLTIEQKNTFVARACAGDATAREAIVSHLLFRVERFAARYISTYSWASHRIEYLDLVEEGNMALYTYIDRALEKENPYGYLTVAAYSAIRQYAKRNRSVIATPHTVNARPIEVCSLDCPMREDNSTLIDMLADPYAGQPSHGSVVRDYAPLQDAVETLTERERIMIIHRYGLNGHEPETVTNIGTMLTLQPNRLYQIEQYALAKLCVKLSSLYCPHAVGILRKRQPKPLDYTLTPEQEHRLHHAQATLACQGRKLTQDALAKEAKINNVAARKYMERFQTETSDIERLDEAYALLEVQGEPITARKLQQCANVGQSAIVSAYLNTRRGTAIRQHPECLQSSQQERLDEAYAALQAQGERISAYSLAKAAHVVHRTAHAYLCEHHIAHPRQRSPQERLDEAYAALQARGEPITQTRLAQKAHVQAPTVRTYLHQRQVAQTLAITR